MFLDKEGRVIRPALLWNDQRTARQCAAITERVGEKRLLRIAGNPALTGHRAVRPGLSRYAVIAFLSAEPFPVSTVGLRRRGRR